MSSRIVCLFAALLLISACSTTGVFIEPESAEEAEATITTATELEEKFGLPSVAIPRANGKDLWVYNGFNSRSDATRFIPYVGLLVGSSKKECTQLRVMVDRETGELSDWEYVNEEDRDHWIKAGENCKD